MRPAKLIATHSRFPVRKSGGDLRFLSASGFALRHNARTIRIRESLTVIAREAISELTADLSRPVQSDFLGGYERWIPDAVEIGTLDIPGGWPDLVPQSVTAEQATYVDCDRAAKRGVGLPRKVVKAESCAAETDAASPQNRGFPGCDILGSGSDFSCQSQITKEHRK
jgi:hypothetical protein